MENQTKTMENTRSLSNGNEIVGSMAEVCPLTEVEKSTNTVKRVENQAKTVENIKFISTGNEIVASMAEASHHF